MTQTPESNRENEEPLEGVTIRDKRRIDPDTLQPRQTAAEEKVETAPEEKDPVAELTNDLQRITAEYANYRKRVERDRELVQELATANLLDQLIPILDDIDRAKEHGDLTGTFATVAENLINLSKKLGLTPFGSASEEFDPNLHEALSTVESDEFETQTVTQVYQAGYKINERILRPAKVVVSQPK